jgi:two-component system, NtrC family, sensor kinase
MAARSRTDTNAVKAKATKTSEGKAGGGVKASSRTAPAANPRRRVSVSEMKRELERRNQELNEAREQQAATAEILKVINASPGDLTPVFDIILEKAHNLCDVPCGSLQLFQGDLTRAVAVRGMTEPFEKFLRQGYRLDRSQPVQLVRPFQIEDLEELAVDAPLGSGLRVAFELGRIRTMLSVPLVGDAVVLGRIVAARQEVRPFSEHQIALLQSFAEQAVIAIQNARLFNETKEALERQTATADILKVIASSPSDVQPVFAAIAKRANSLVGGFSSTVFQFIGGTAHLRAFTPTTPDADEVLKSAFPRPVADFLPFQLAQAGKATQIPDTELLTNEIKEIARARGYRSMLFAPLMNKGVSIGFIAVTRIQAGNFAGHHMQLLQTFADQAVIAIENARLFDEVQARTRELSEALTYQTGSANILRVIASSPTDVAPVLNSIVESACELCEAYDSVVTLRDGNELSLGAHHGPIPMSQQRWSNDRTSISGRAMADRRPVHVHDVLSDEGADFAIAREMSRVDGCRTLLGAPLLREGESVGAIVLRRAEAHPFSDKQIALLQTFADQAVIAIGNVRLFEEVQARTRQLSKSLEDLRTAQDRLIQTEKLASLGQLTAGIAHEIKNPLNFVNNFSALSLELTDELKEILNQEKLTSKGRENVDEVTGLLRDNLGKVIQHGKRADSIVKNMLMHSREGSGDRRSADVNALVAESLNLAYHGARAEKAGFEITLKHDLDPEAGALDLYPQEMTRALLNLISNGFYAASKRRMEAGDGTFEPTVSAATKNFGKTVQIRIRDNGTGIPPDVREKIFNPFFTTKPTGEGTGLGLSMAHDIIVKQHGGRIDVETETGVFTEFIITLPRERGAA